MPLPHAPSRAWRSRRTSRHSPAADRHLRGLRSIGGANLRSGRYWQHRPMKLTKFAPKRGRCRVGWEDRARSWRVSESCRRRITHLAPCRKMVGLLFGEPRVQRRRIPRSSPARGGGPRSGGGGGRLGEAQVASPLHHAAHGPPPRAGEDFWKKTLTLPPPAGGRGVLGGWEEDWGVVWAPGIEAGHGLCEQGRCEVAG